MWQRQELSGYGFGALFEVGFQDRTLPLIRDAVRYTLLLESSKPVGADPVHFHLDQAISCPHLNHEQRLPESRHRKQCAKALVQRTGKHLDGREAVTGGRRLPQPFSAWLDDGQRFFRLYRDELNDSILPDQPLRVVKQLQPFGLRDSPAPGLFRLPRSSMGGTCEYAKGPDVDPRLPRRVEVE
jgi:hypothetical protein